MANKAIAGLVHDSMTRVTGAIRTGHINAAAQQAGGRPSKSGGIYGRERQIHSDHIDAQNKRVWPAHGDMSAKHRKQRTGVKGGLKGSNGNGPPGIASQYSGGNGRKHG